MADLESALVDRDVISSKLVTDKSSSTITNSHRDSLMLQPQELLNQLKNRRTGHNNLVHTNESSPTVDVISTDQISSILAKRHNLIKYYYLSNSSDQVELEVSTLRINTGLKLKFNWLKDGKQDKLYEENVFDLELGVKYKRALDKKITGLIWETREVMEEARKENELTYIHWLCLENIGWWTPLNLIQAKVNYIWNLFFCRLWDVLFVVSGNKKRYGKCNCLESIFELIMMHQEKTKVIKKILNVIEGAEIELETIGKYKLIGSTERADHQGNQDYNEMEIDRIMDMFF